MAREICTNMAGQMLEDPLYSIVAIKGMFRLNGEPSPSNEELAALAQIAVLKAFTGLPVTTEADGTTVITLANGTLRGQGLQWLPQNEQLNGMRRMLAGFLQQALDEGHEDERRIHEAFEFALRDVGASLNHPRVDGSNVVQWDLVEGYERVIISGYGRRWWFGPNYLKGLADLIPVNEAVAEPV